MSENERQDSVWVRERERDLPLFFIYRIASDTLILDKESHMNLYGSMDGLIPFGSMKSSEEEQHTVNIVTM